MFHPFIDRMWWNRDLQFQTLIVKTINKVVLNIKSISYILLNVKEQAKLSLSKGFIFLRSLIIKTTNKITLNKTSTFYRLLDIKNTAKLVLSRTAPPIKIIFNALLTFVGNITQGYGKRIWALLLRTKYLANRFKITRIW